MLPLPKAWWKINFGLFTRKSQGKQLRKDFKAATFSGGADKAAKPGSVGEGAVTKNDATSVEEFI